MMFCLLAALLPTLATGGAGAKGAVKLPVPHVEYHIDEASATTSPWIDANGWRILRNPGATYYYDVPAGAAALAAAEAFAYGADARVHTDAPGANLFAQMLEFLRGIPDQNLSAMANIGVVDDRSDETGELMNLLSRRNLLYKIVGAPDSKLDLNVRIGSPEYPKSEAEDPAFLAQKIRAKLGDDRRFLRVYGSEIVIARLLGDNERGRIHLLNYGKRHVIGLRVRVRGEYPRQRLFASHSPGAGLADVVVQGGATEFTVPDLATYAVIDLSH